MTADGEPLELPAAPAARPKQRRAGVAPVPAAEGVVLCPFDGAPEGLPALQFAARSAVAAGRRLVVSHVETRSTGFWTAAYSGYGACLGPPDRLFCSTSEAAFAAAVEGLLEIPVAWDFASSRSSRSRALRDLIARQEVAVVVLDGERRLARRLARRNGALTVVSI